jgi:hypothetical protein
LDSGEVVQIGLQVFQEEGERLQKLFLVYLNHGTGSPLFRVLLITNCAVYLLTQTAMADDAAVDAAAVEDQEGDQVEAVHWHATVYKTELTVPLSAVVYISVGASLFSIYYMVILLRWALMRSRCRWNYIVASTS